LENYSIGPKAENSNPTKNYEVPKLFNSNTDLALLSIPYGPIEMPFSADFSTGNQLDSLETPMTPPPFSIEICRSDTVVCVMDTGLVNSRTWRLNAGPRKLNIHPIILATETTSAEPWNVLLIVDFTVSL
jgi:hypothetical protein